MTIEKKRLVRYVEVMEWHRAIRGSDFPRWNFPDFGDGLRIWRVSHSNSNGKIWNPLTDANDALELAEKMGVKFERSEGAYHALLPPGSKPRWVKADTLPAAICAAVDAALDAK